MSDTLNIFGTEYSGVTGIIASTPSETELTYVRPQGTLSITSAGNNIDVAQYATASVASGSATPAASISATGATVSTSTNTLTLTKSSVSNTPQVSAGFISSGTAGNSSVSLSATVTTKGATTYTPATSNQTIASGTYLTGTQTISGDANLVAGNIKSGTSIFGVTGTYTGGGGDSKNVQINQSTTRTTTSTLSKANGDLTVSKTGTYDVYWTATRSNTSTSYTWGSQLYVGGSAYGSENTTWSNHVQNNHLSNVSLTADQKIAVYTRGRSGSYYVYAPMLVIVEA